MTVKRRGKKGKEEELRERGDEGKGEGLIGGKEGKGVDRIEEETE